MQGATIHRLPVSRTFRAGRPDGAPKATVPLLIGSPTTSSPAVANPASSRVPTTGTDQSTPLIPSKTSAAAIIDGNDSQELQHKVQASYAEPLKEPVQPTEDEEAAHQQPRGRALSHPSFVQDPCAFCSDDGAPPVPPPPPAPLSPPQSSSVVNQPRAPVLISDVEPLPVEKDIANVCSSLQRLLAHMSRATTPPRSPPDGAPMAHRTTASPPPDRKGSPESYKGREMERWARRQEDEQREQRARERASGGATYSGFAVLSRSASPTPSHKYRSPPQGACVGARDEHQHRQHVVRRSRPTVPRPFHLATADRSVERKQGGEAEGVRSVPVVLLDKVEFVEPVARPSQGDSIDTTMVKAQVASLKRSLKQKSVELNRLQDRLAAERVAWEDARTELAQERDDALKRANKSRAAHNTQASRMHEKDDKLARTLKELWESEQANTELKQKLADMTRQLQTIQHQLQSANGAAAPPPSAHPPEPPAPGDDLDAEVRRVLERKGDDGEEGRDVNEGLRQHVAELEESLTKSQGEVETLQAQQREVAKALADSLEENASLQVNIQQLKEEKKKEDDARKADVHHEERCRLLEYELSRSEVKADRLARELETLKDEHATLTAQKATMESESDGQLRGLHHIISEKDEELARLEKRVLSLERELESARQTLSQSLRTGEASASGPSSVEKADLVQILRAQARSTEMLLGELERRNEGQEQGDNEQTSPLFGERLDHHKDD
ncbi:unnamed protein product [Vitrella brassicaformis CCMP3155]|uniref:Uncharacterized protein n=2 Tax=Vitrella brassicaformis TaxID=1169539 RepID=A0A0G4G6Z7_VITBC|nr:unnamed protein product [Vitrella brassicaformis CCMP3155]|eukprot:CEM24484.1 unnamed protein product [Vitrella brassicaformis CCMP3155]